MQLLSVALWARPRGAGRNHCKNTLNESQLSLLYVYMYFFIHVYITVGLTLLLVLLPPHFPLSVTMS